MLDLSIIVVSFNARDDLVDCLASLHASPPRASHEIIVVDNASTDGSPEAARAWADVQVIELAQNAGFARGNNIGIRASTGTLLLLLNSDTVVPARAIDGLIEELSARPDVAVIGPRLVDASGRAELSFGRMIGPLNELRQKTLVRGQAVGLPIVSGLVERLTRRPQAVDWVSGACLLVRRDDAFAAGLLDERYFMYAEDVDFCAAVRNNGRRVWFTPAVEIVHARGRSARTAPAATDAAYRRSQLAFYDKHHPRWAPLLRLYLKWRRADT
jgi:N-acetylglucosaminyl-diphospho-decaprenol L-rhamnosyltransferase